MQMYLKAHIPLRAKICGITRSEDALLACGLGADAIGFIFYEKSPRYIRPTAAARIAKKLPRHVARVGVFANPAISEVGNALAEFGLDAIQLHGKHDLNLINYFRQKTKIICAFNISPDFDFTILESYQNKTDAFLLDGYEKGNYGGTGKQIDWQKAQSAKTYGRVILAGGLNPENVQEAVCSAAPYAVDVNSGVEDRPGIKNPQQLEQFFQKIKDYRRDWQPTSASKFPLA